MRLSKDAKENFRHDMHRKFVAYWHSLHPNTLNFHDLVPYVWPEEVVQALDTVFDYQEERGWTGRYSKAFLETDDILRVHLKSLEGRRPYLEGKLYIGADLSPGRGNMRRGSFKWNLPDDFDDTMIPDDGLRKKFLAWGAEAYRFKAILDAFDKHLENVLYWCATPGQLNLIWPELASHLDSDRCTSMTYQKRKSKWPDGIGPEYVENMKEWDYISEINTALLAMVVMDNKEDDNYPIIG